MEFGLGEVDEHGRRHLSPDELAHAIAFALTDRGPTHNRFIQDALKKGELKTKDNVARLVQQLLDEQLTTGHWEWDRKDLPRIMRFFDEFFGFHRAGTVFKDNDRQRAENIPQWNTAMLIHDARMLIEHVLKEDENVIAELLTTNEYFIAHPGDNEYAREFYEQKVAEVTAPDYVAAQVAIAKEQIDRRQERTDVRKYSPEEIERRLDEARKNAEKTVLKFKTALEKGIIPHPEVPFLEPLAGDWRSPLHRALQPAGQPSPGRAALELATGAAVGDAGGATRRFADAPGVVGGVFAE